MNERTQENKNFMSSLFETTENTRDIGGYDTLDGRKTKCHTLLRSDVSEHPSENDIIFLKKYNITTVIDLRSEEEAVRRPSGFACLPKFHYVNCPVPEGSGIPESVELVPDSYLTLAESAGMKSAFQAIADAKTGVLYHCTAGKDRTGVLSAILMLEAGAADEEIIADYMLTRECIKERLRSMHEHFPEIDMNIVTPREWYMEQFLKLFRERYGDARGYFQKIGLQNEDIMKIHKKIRDNKGEMKLILASASPRRTQLLSQIGLEHSVIPSNCPEVIHEILPEKMVMELAEQKAEDVYHSYRNAHSDMDDFTVIGADTVVALDGEIFGKPKNKEDAYRMLHLIQGKRHQVYTGVALLSQIRGETSRKVFYECSQVRVYPMTDAEIYAYIESGEAMDKAGSYGIQGRFAAYIQGIDGDYNTIVGLPAARLYHELDILY